MLWRGASFGNQIVHVDTRPNKTVDDPKFQRLRGLWSNAPWKLIYDGPGAAAGRNAAGMHSEAALHDQPGPRAFESCLYFFRENIPDLRIPADRRKCPRPAPPPAVPSDALPSDAGRPSGVRDQTAYVTLMTAAAEVVRQRPQPWPAAGHATQGLRFTVSFRSRLFGRDGARDRVGRPSRLAPGWASLASTGDRACAGGPAQRISLAAAKGGAWARGPWRSVEAAGAAAVARSAASPAAAAGRRAMGRSRGFMFLLSERRRRGLGR